MRHVICAFNEAVSGCNQLLNVQCISIATVTIGLHALNMDFVNQFFTKCHKVFKSSTVRLAEHVVCTVAVYNKQKFVVGKSILKCFKLQA